MNVLGHVFSALSLFVLLISNVYFGPISFRGKGILRCVEYLLLAVAAYYFKARTVAVVMICIAVSAIQRAYLERRRPKRALWRVSLVIIAIAVGIIVNNSGWFAVFPIIIALRQLTAPTDIWPQVSIDNIDNALHRGEWWQYMWLTVTLGFWIANAAIIGDYCTLYSRIGLTLINTVRFIKAEWRSKDEISRLHFRRTHKRNYRSFSGRH